MLSESTAGPDIAGKLCPYCQNRIAAGSSAVVCPGCRTPHHAECWDYNGGCTTFGCRNAPGAETPGPARPVPMTDDSLGIVLHPGPGGVSPFGVDARPSQPHGAAVDMQRVLDHPKRNLSWLWAAMSVAVLAAMIGAVLIIHRPASPATPYLQQADQHIKQGDSERAAQECSQAIAVDQNCVGAYYRKGLILLGFTDRRAGDRLSQLIDQASRGETCDLDAADDCFRQCIQRAPRGEDTDVGGTSLTGSQIIASSKLNLALTATLRVAANRESGHPDYASQWAATARQYVGQAKQSDLDSKGYDMANTIEGLLDELGY